jgi:tetratricopeptide (TPR) repeat protein
LKFSLDPLGKIRDWKIQRSSNNHEFDALVERAFLQASVEFACLPKGSAVPTEFELTARVSDVSVVPILFKLVRDFGERILKPLCLEYRIAKTAYMLTLRANSTLVEPMPSECRNDELAYILKNAIDEGIRYPGNFPDETRFVVSFEHGCSVTTYSRTSLPVEYPDALDKRTRARFRYSLSILEKPKLVDAEDRLSREPDNIELIESKARRLYHVEGLGSALAWLSDATNLFPQGYFPYRLKAELLFDECSSRGDFSKMKEEILQLYHQALSKDSPSSYDTEYIWCKIGLTLAVTGNYEEFSKAVENITCADNPGLAERSRYLCHSRMAEFFECAGEWEKAIIEWEKAFEHSEGLNANAAQFALRYCEDQLTGSAHLNRQIHLVNEKRRELASRLDVTIPSMRDGLTVIQREILLANFLRHANRPKQLHGTYFEKMAARHRVSYGVVFNQFLQMVRTLHKYPLMANAHELDWLPEVPLDARKRGCTYEFIKLPELSDFGRIVLGESADVDLTSSFLPVRLPVLLISGWSFTTTGRCANIPPHNISEVINAVLAKIANPQLGSTELTEIIRGPDFALGGIIPNGRVLRKGYATGNVAFWHRCGARIGSGDRGRKCIWMRPFSLPLAEEQLRIAVEKNKVHDVTDCAEDDLSGELVVELRRDADEQSVLTEIYRTSGFRTLLQLDMTVLEHGSPVRISVAEAIQCFIEDRVNSLAEVHNVRVDAGVELLKRDLLELHDIYVGNRQTIID